MRRGDVVIIDHPYPSGVGSKVRPALVVSSDRDHARISYLIVATITTNLGRSQEPTHLLIELTSPEGQQSGLQANSLVSCNNLFTVQGRLVRRTIGSLPAQVMARIDDCLKAALALP